MFISTKTLKKLLIFVFLISFLTQVNAISKESDFVKKLDSENAKHQPSSAQNKIIENVFRNLKGLFSGVKTLSSEKSN